MSLTQFFPVFMVLLCWSFSSPRAWLIACVTAATFQAASPFTLPVGGRMIGVNGAYLLLAPAAYHYVKMAIAERRSGVTGAWDAPLNPAQWLLIIFAMYAALGAIALPRIFEGVTRILPPQDGLDIGMTYPLIAGTGNLIQASYVLLNLSIVLLVVFFHRRRAIQPQDLIVALKVSLACITLFGVYQLIAYRLGLPWPSDFINSNAAASQSYEQVLSTVKRMTATFIEPSMLAMHLLGLLAGLYTARVHVGWIVLAIIDIGLTTSTVGYVGVIMLLACALAGGLVRKDYRRIVALSACAGCSIGLVILVDSLLFSGEVVQMLLVKKMDQNSGIARVSADLVAFQNFYDTFGLGVGVGSMRASSIAATSLATTGAFGTFTLGLAVILSISGSLANASRAAKGAGAAMGGLLIGACLGVPDFGLPFTWIVLGLASAAVPVTVFRRPARARSGYA